MDKTSIIVGDSSYLSRLALQNIFEQYIDLSLLGSFSLKEDLLLAVSDKKPDVVILNMSNGEFTLDDVKYIKSISGAIAIILIEKSNNKELVSSAFDAGAIGYLLTSCEEVEIVDAVKAASNNQNFFCGKVIDVMLGNAAPENVNINESTLCDPINLSDREIEIVKHIALGHTNQEIAEKLFLSTHTVNTHRKNIMKKLELRNTAGVVLYAVNQKIIDVDSTTAG